MKSKVPAAHGIGFVRSGLIYPANASGTLEHVGNNGRDWASRGASLRSDGVTTPSAYDISINLASVEASSGPSSRYLGFPPLLP